MAKRKKNVVYGYIYDENGMHDGKRIFEGTPKNIANFIMYNMMSPTVITDTVDNFLVSSTVGGFLDRVSSPKLREQILEAILPLQMMEEEPVEPEYLD